MADDSKPTIPVSLDDFLQYSPVGPLQTAIGNNFYGINHRQTPAAVPINKDNYGLTFFVRPQLNMQTGNLRNMRLFTPLLSNDPNSYQRIVRCLLDPRIMYGYETTNTIDPNAPSDYTSLKCPFVDNSQAFIPILTNHLKSISGWPDVTVPTHTSKEGAYQEAHSMVDGISVNYTAYDIEATFRNSKGDPIMALFHAWVHYQTAVFEGNLVPYPDMLSENEIDYNTRIYRIILDPTKTKLQKIAATGVSFPSSLPMAGYFDYSSEKPYNDANSDITIRFRCNGAQYLDDILISEFNATVAIFNPSMDGVRSKAGVRDSSLDRDMVQIPHDYLAIFNNRGYPRIDPDTYDFNWYVSKRDFTNKMQAISDFSGSLPTTNNFYNR
jgi:hypothetical protein